MRRQERRVRRRDLRLQRRPGLRCGHHDHRLQERQHRLLEDRGRRGGLDGRSHRCVHRRRSCCGMHPALGQQGPDHGLQPHRFRLQPQELDEARQAAVCEVRVRPGNSVRSRHDHGQGYRRLKVAGRDRLGEGQGVRREVRHDPSRLRFR